MKKILCMTLTIIVFLFSLSGCNTDKYASLPDEYVAETDYPSGFAATYNRFPIAPGEGGYYFTMGDFLFFMDGETKEIAPVCSRPDCRHENESDSSLVWQCNAHLGSFNSKFLQVYEESLYCLSSGGQGEDGKLDISASSRLLKVALDGTAHEFLCPMPLNLEFTAIHRGYLYYAYMTDEDSMGLFRKKMDSLTEEPETIFSVDDVLSGSCFFLYGSHLYFYIGKADNSSTIVYDYDLNSGEVKELFDKQIIVGLVKGRLLCRKQNLDMSTESQTAFSLYDAQKGELEALCTLPVDQSFSWPEYSTDGNYIYQFLSPRGYAEQEDYNGDDGRHVMAVYDMEGNQVDFVDLPNLPAAISFAPGDEEYGFFWYEKIHDEEQPLCMDLLKKKDGFQSENVFRRCYAGLRPGLMYTE